jgi:hypothetical protein
MTRAIIAAGLLAGCATGWTRQGIATTLDASLKTQHVVSVIHCDPVFWAMRTCEAAGMELSCAWDGFNDRDHDSFTIAACLERGKP